MSWANFYWRRFPNGGAEGRFLFVSARTGGEVSGIASGSWALVNYVLLQFLGPMFNQHQYSEAFWTIALCPVAGVIGWLWLSRKQAVANSARAGRGQFQIFGIAAAIRRMCT